MNRVLPTFVTTGGEGTDVHKDGHQGGAGPELLIFGSLIIDWLLIDEC
jgi:hypothetical protein